MTKFPTDLLTEIFKYIPYQEFPKLALVCESFNQAINRELFWNHLCIIYSLQKSDQQSSMKCFKNHIEDYWQWQSSSAKTLTTKMKFPHRDGYPAINPLDRLHNSCTIKLSQINNSYYVPLIGIVNSEVYKSKSNFEKGSIMLKSGTLGSVYSVDHNCKNVTTHSEFKVCNADCIKFKLGLNESKVQVFCNDVLMCEIEDKTDCWYPLIIANGQWEVEFI